MDEKKSFAEQYRVLELVGAGGQGQVFRVQENETGRVYAAKKIPLSSWDEVSKLETEVRALRGLNGGHIPRFKEMFVDESFWKTPDFILIMDYVEGKNFSERMQKGERFTEEQLQDFRKQTLEALTEAHSTGIVHRDIKPSNVMLSDEGLVYVTDFGLAKFLGEKTQTNSLGKGSICYMAPEQVNGLAITPETDYYQLGLTLIALASGKERTDDYRHEDPHAQIKKLGHLSDSFRASLTALVSENAVERRRGLEERVDAVEIVKVEEVHDIDTLKGDIVNAENGGAYYFAVASLCVSAVLGSVIVSSSAMGWDIPALLICSAIGTGVLAVGLRGYTWFKNRAKNKERDERDSLIAGKYILMPQTSTYAKGVEALRREKVARPFTFKENLQARVEAYESGDHRLFDTWLDSCTGIAYKAGTTKFKIIPHCAELMGIHKDFSNTFLPVEYDRIKGVELDSSKGKYNQGLTNAEILEHPAWLAAVEGDTTLLRTYTDIVFSAYVTKYGSSDKLMRFYVRENTPTDELRAVFVHVLSGSSGAGGDVLSNVGRFLRQ